MQGIKTKCKNCNGSFHVTTEHFNPTKKLNGKMFKLQEKYGPGRLNWDSFPYDVSTRDADLECPQCGSDYNYNLRFYLSDNKTVTKKELREIYEEEKQKKRTKGSQKKKKDKEQELE